MSGVHCVWAGVVVLFAGMIPEPTNAMRMEYGLSSYTECHTSYTGTPGNLVPYDHWCTTTYVWEETGAYYDEQFDFLEYWGGGGWNRELNMLEVPGNWNGTVKVNKAGTKVVATGVRCVGDEEAFRQQIAQAAMGIAQTNAGSPFPMGQQITLNMDGGDTQTFYKTMPSSVILLAPVPGSAGECKPGS